MAKSRLPGTYNADEKALERGKQTIIIGGRSFHPRKKTIKMMDEWNQVAPRPDETEDRDRDPMENFRDVYRQLVVFLTDDEGQQPPVEFLEEELDVEEAVDLLILLQPTIGIEQERARDLVRGAAETAT